MVGERDPLLALLRRGAGVGLVVAGAVAAAAEPVELRVSAAIWSRSRPASVTSWARTAASSAGVQTSSRSVTWVEGRVMSLPVESVDTVFVSTPPVGYPHLERTATTGRSSGARSRQRAGDGASPVACAP